MWAWECNDSYGVGEWNVDVPGVREGILGLDLDGTLIEPKSGNRFPKDANDWKWKFPLSRIRKMLKNNSGKNLVIISNQLHNNKKKTLPAHAEEIHKKLKTIVTQLAFDGPLSVIVSFQKDRRRKPRAGMVDTFCERTGVEPDAAKCMYVGDAAGRTKDHGDSDLKLALNLGWKFMIPEAFFGNCVNNYALPVFNPRRLYERVQGLPPVVDLVTEQLRNGDKKLFVIMVGAPGSGKTYLAKQLALKLDMEVVNQDTLKRKERCWKAVEDCIAYGRPCVYDRQNATAADRQDVLKMVPAEGWHTVVIHFDLPKELVQHQLEYRKFASANGGLEVPTLVVHSFFKNLEPPSETEHRVNQLITVPAGSYSYGPTLDATTFTEYLV